MFSEITRRELFKKAGVLGAALALSGCGGDRAEERLVPFLDSPEDQVAGVFTYFASACQECSAGCGILVKLMGGRAHKIEGNPRHPVNQGRLCAMGQAALQGLYNPDRVPGPRERSGREAAFGSTDWNKGLAKLTDAVRGAGGKGGVAVWGGGHLSDHLSQLVGLFLTAVNGSGGGTWNTRPVVWDVARATQGETLLQDLMGATTGEAGMPSFAVGSSDLVVSFAADFLDHWLSPVSFGREYAQLRRNIQGRGRVIHVSSRFSATAAVADRWIATPPGREGEVALVLGRVILDEGLAAKPGVPGVDAVFAGVKPRELADSMGLSFEELVQVARLLGAARAPLALPGGGLTGYANGRDSLGAVMALDLLLGAQRTTLGRAPVVTSPPAAAQDVLQAGSVSSFADVRDLIKAMQSGAVKVLLVLDGDPAHDLPQALGFEQAAAKVPLIVDCSPFPTDTQMALADLVLPRPTPLETWGYSLPQAGAPVATVSAQQPVVTQLYDTRSSADILLFVAKALGGQAAAALPWKNEVEFVKARIATLRTAPGGSIQTTDADAFVRTFQEFGGWWQMPGQTSVPTAESSLGMPVGLTGVRVPAHADPRTTPPLGGDAAARPYVLEIYPHPLIGGGRGANRSWLQEVPATLTSIGWWSWAEIHPTVADKLGVTTGDLIKVSSPAGSVEVPAYVYPAARPDTVAIPLGQGHRFYGRYAEGRGVNPLDLLELVEVAGTGELAWGATRVSVEKASGHRRLARLEGSDARLVPQGL